MKRTRIIAAVLVALMLFTVPAFAASSGNSIFSKSASCPQNSTAAIRSLTLDSLFAKNIVDSNKCAPDTSRPDAQAKTDCSTGSGGDCSTAGTSKACNEKAPAYCGTAKTSAPLNASNKNPANCAGSSSGKACTGQTTTNPGKTQNCKVISGSCINKADLANLFSCIKGGDLAGYREAILNILCGRKDNNTPESETPDVPDETPDIPDETPDVPDETPDVPDETPDVPDETPDVPDETPDVPDGTPDVPDNGGKFDIPAGATYVTAGEKSVYIGETESMVLATLGQPGRKDAAGSLTWYVYNSDYSSFLMAGISGGKVSSIYTCAKDFELGGPTTGATLYKDKLGGGTYAVLVGSAGSGSSTDALSAQVFDITNAWRVAQGRRALSWESAAAKGAVYHSGDMAAKNYFSHTSPDGKSGIDRYNMYSQESWRAWGENIAAGQPNAFSVMDGWINSSGHRSNILSSSFNYLGVGTVRGGSYGIYWTQFFIGR